jgi:phosphatidylglycerophosphate synthase
MFDRLAATAIAPAVQIIARQLHRWGWRADWLTWMGFLLGIFASILIACRGYQMGLLLMIVSRLLDALDGAVARLSQPTDAGGFLDIALDFLFYASVPLAFAISDPAQNALPAAVLLAAFVGTGSSFLAFATLAAKRGLHNPRYPQKSFYFLGGLTEATETLLCFAAMCLWPPYFAVLAYGFAVLCAVTIVTRVLGGYAALKEGSATSAGPAP